MVQLMPKAKSVDENLIVDFEKVKEIIADVRTVRLEKIFLTKNRSFTNYQWT